MSEIKIVDKIEVINPEDLIPYSDNPRSHEKSRPELEKSVDAVGFYSPLIIDQNNRIVCGHNRRALAISKKMPGVPCVRVELTDQEYIKIMLSDNKITELSKYNNKTLKVCLNIVDSLETPPIGFSEKDIAKVFGIKPKNEDGSDEANFGEAGTVKVESDEHNAGIIKRKIFQLTPDQHEDITAKLRAVQKANGFDNEASALVKIFENIKRLPKTVVKAGPVKVVSCEEQ